MFFNWEYPPTNAFATLLWPVVLFAIAAAISLLAFRAESRKQNASWRWAAMLPLFIGLLIGLSALRVLREPNYDSWSLAYEMGRKVTLALWGSLALPVLGILGFVGWRVWYRWEQTR